MTGSQRWTKADGTQASPHSSTELDPMGVDAGVVNWAQLAEMRRMGGELVAPRYGDSLDQIVGCTGSGAPAACGGYLRDIVTGGGASVFRNMGRTLAGEGPSIQRVIAYGRDGRVLHTSSRILLPGQSGWDGSLDGTYRRGEVPGDTFIAWNGGIFNRVSGGAGFADFSATQKLPTVKPEDFGENPDRWTKLKNLAFADAKDALLNDKKCRQFLGLSERQVTGLVRALWKNAQFADIGAVARTSGEGKSATISLGRRFFSDTEYRAYLQGPSAYGPDDSMQWRAFTVLHEIAHALNRIPNDRASDDQSFKNDRKVYEECQRGISTLSRLGDYGGGIPPPR